MKDQPIDPASNNSIGTFVVAHAPTNNKTFENLLPLLIRTEATGKAAYSGPAEKEPKNSASETPRKPEFSPISLMMVSRGTHTSKRTCNVQLMISCENPSHQNCHNKTVNKRKPVPDNGHLSSKIFYFNRQCNNAHRHQGRYKNRELH